MDLLSPAQLAINYRDDSVSGLSPLFLEHGYHVKLISQKHNLNGNAKSQPTKRAKVLMERIREVEKFAVSAIAATQQEMEAQANRSGNPSPLFRVGDKV